MSILIREYLGYTSQGKDSLGIKEASVASYQSLDPVAPNSLMVDIEGIHEGATRNFTRYMKSALTSSIDSWTKPYQKPLIMHHNEKDGKIIGRIKNVYYTDVKTRSGTGALVFTANVPDKDGAEQIEDGRLMTTSIGILGHDVRCSICQQNIAEYGECEHERGVTYGDETCYWDVHDMEGKELSYVIVPSDAYAKNIKIYRPSGRTEISESSNEKGVLAVNMKESEKKMENVRKNLNKTEDIKESAKEEAVEEVVEEAVEEKAKDNTARVEAESLKAEIEELNRKVKEAKEKIDAIEKTAASVQQELSGAKLELEDKSQALKEETDLRETLENNAIEKEKELKEALAENFNLMREMTGKARIEDVKIQERSMVSIRDGILDLKEELSQSGSPKTVTKVKDPTITESKNDSVKKEKKAGNVDLEEGLEALFSNLTGNFSKQ